MHSRGVIKKLLETSGSLLQELNEIYKLLPTTRCRRRTHCCSMLPEMTLVEALLAIQRLVYMAPAMRRRVVQNIIGYFFLNPVEITSCPFLDGQDCLIYEDRFFGCRAYGLWSREYYEELAARNRQSKTFLQKQWENLGVSLPQRVIDFQVPYCLCVEIDGNVCINDKMLLNISNKILELSHRFSHWHKSFSQRYFSDLGFLLASLVFGLSEAVQMKFTVVRDIVTLGNRSRLDRIVGELPDLCPKR